MSERIEEKKKVQISNELFYKLKTHEHQGGANQYVTLRCTKRETGEHMIESLS